MPLDAAGFRALFPALPQATDPLLEQALAYAEDRVARAYGPAYDPARPVLVARWRRIGYQAWPVTLCLPHPVDSVALLRFHDQDLVEADYSVRRNVGQLSVRRYITWRTEIECEYTPQDRTALRDAVQGQVAMWYLHRTMQAMPVSGGAAMPRQHFDTYCEEDNALARLSVRLMSVNLPNSVEYKPGQ